MTSDVIAIVIQAIETERCPVCRAPLQFSNPVVFPDKWHIRCPSCRWECGGQYPDFP